MRLLSGIDIVDVDEVRKLLENDGEAFIEGHFTDEEKKYCESRKKMRHEHYAGRLAVKQAFLKALGRDGKSISVGEIGITRERGHAPELHLSEAAKAKTGIESQDKIFVSLAHERKIAVGTVVIVKQT